MRKKQFLLTRSGSFKSSIYIILILVSISLRTLDVSVWVFIQKVCLKGLLNSFSLGCSPYLSFTFERTLSTLGGSFSPARFHFQKQTSNLFPHLTCNCSLGQSGKQNHYQYWEAKFLVPVRKDLQLFKHKNSLYF